MVLCGERRLAYKVIGNKGLVGGEAYLRRSFAPGEPGAGLS